MRDLIDISGAAKIRFNACPDADPNWNVPYSSLVHEAGHALRIAHPEKWDSIMNYRQREPDCSPHPFDIMAVFAIYQTLD